MSQRVELAVSDRYAREHGWVLTAITGFLSAYYLEDPRFRFKRRYQDLDAGVYVWLCEVDDGMPVTGLIRRLQADIPSGRVLERSPTAPCARFVIDLPEPERKGP